MNRLHMRFWPKDVPEVLLLPQTNVAENLRITALRYPDLPSIIFYGSTLTFKQVNEAVDALSGYLAEDCGVKKGDRVMLMMQNSPQFIIAFQAIMRANAVVIPVSPMLVTEELAYFAEDSGAKVILTAQELFGKVAPLVGNKLTKAIVAAYADALTAPPDLTPPDFIAAPYSVPASPGVVPWTEALAKGRKAPPLTTGPDDHAVFPYTSGTTGRPKGCIHTHKTVMSTILAGPAWRNICQPGGVQLASLPFFHVTGMQAVMNASLYIGAAIVILPRWDRDIAGHLITRYKITDWVCITTMVVDFLNNPNLTNYDITSLKRISGGGAAMPKAVAQKLLDMTGLTFIEGYGLSETMAPSHHNPIDRPKQQCLGVPIFDVDSRVIDPNTLEELPNGQIGEIITRGPQVFLGYWNDPVKTEDSFIVHDGETFFRTGDLGYIDEDGYFFFTDRLKRMINCSGMKVWPAEVESILYQHPALNSCCIIASKDEHRGETVKLVAVKKPGVEIDPAEIESWARERMAAYKVPRLYEFVDALPVSATGKVNWRALQEKEAAKVG